jgi:hypothetical protein
MSEEKPMAQYRFKADETRIFGDLSLEIAPGDIHDFDGDPPGPAEWWEAVSDEVAPPVADAAPPADAAPADAAPDTDVAAPPIEE